MINFEKNISNYTMHRIFSLKEELNNDPERVKQTQEVTLDKNKPFFGLKGNLGLFGSDLWWENIDNGKFPTKEYFGIITRVYAAGFECETENKENDSIDILLSDGTIQSVGLYINNKKNINLIQKNKIIYIKYILDELKHQPNQQHKNYLNIAIEVYISTELVDLT